jgi:hypothetical protein
VPPSDVTAVRLDDTLAIAWLPDYPRRQPRDVDLATVDSSSGLALLSVKTAGDALTLTPWTPLRPQDPRYLLATTAHSGGVSLRPVFVPALAPVIRAAWPGQLWRTASDSGLSPGSFVFTLGGDFAGLVIDDGGERAIVGGDALQAEIDRLRSVPPRTPGYLGVEVQALSPAVAAVTGATGGVVVTWVDPDGAAAGAIGVGDVIEEANGERLALEQWAVRIARLSAGATVTVRARRGGEMREVALVARAREPSVAAQLGLILRTVPGVGSEVIRVMPSAAAQRAGIEPGDVITMAGDTKTPTAAQVRGTYASGGTDRGVLLALTRGAVHRVVVLER